MRALVATHPQQMLHDPGPRHPERPARLEAVLSGAKAAGLGETVAFFEPRPATRDELHLVHSEAHVAAVEALVASGGGHLDPDTVASAGSFEAALLAAGAGLDGIERLERGEADAVFCAGRPPGHHASRDRAMGFCLFNNAAVAAAFLAARGERVLIADFDAHHGNGTQETFYTEDRVAYVSFHQYPFYPGTGALDECGEGDGVGTTINFPMPAGSTGDEYRRGVGEVVVPFAQRWAPTWVVLSAGFDAHRDDPLTMLGLSSGDFGDLTRELIALAPPGRRLVFLEGGYDLEALSHSTGACLAALVGETYRPEAPTSGGNGRDAVDAVVEFQRAASA